MTDPHDRRDRSDSDAEEDQEEALSHKTGRSDNTPKNSDTDDSSIEDRPLTIGETSPLKTKKIPEKLQKQASPAPAIERTSPQRTTSETISLRRSTDQLERTVQPLPGISKHTAIVEAHNLSVTRIAEDPIEQTQPRRDSEIRQGDLPVNTLSLAVTRHVDRLETETRPTTTLSQARVRGGNTLVEELEEMDPVFGWKGGHPYGIDRPHLIIHRDEDDVPSFEFLQRCLRDTHSELRGGEPTVKQVEFVANEPQIPTVDGKIVTLDLAEGDWSPAVKEGTAKIERGGIDIVPTLGELATRLYSGQLGFAVVNVPTDWEDEFRRPDFFSRLVEQITSTAPSEDGVTGDDTATLSKLRIAPVTVAQPRVTDPDTFDARVAQYFGFDRVPDWETIEQADAAYSTILRSERWAQVALTERQSHGEESSRHYNWKGLITEGIARRCWTAATDREVTFPTFVEEELLQEDRLLTEEPTDGNSAEDSAAIADVVLKTGPDWVSDAIQAFGPEKELALPFALEFETGFSEGAFQYRKLVESLEKYEAVENIQTALLVIPPRLLYRGERQARLLDRLVVSVDDQLETVTALLSVPVLADGSCVGVRYARPVINTLYEDV